MELRAFIDEQSPRGFNPEALDKHSAMVCSSWHYLVTDQAKTMLSFLGVFTVLDRREWIWLPLSMASFAGCVWHDTATLTEEEVEAALAELEATNILKRRFERDRAWFSVNANMDEWAEKWNWKGLLLARGSGMRAEDRIGPSRAVPEEIVKWWARRKEIFQLRRKAQKVRRQREEEKIKREIESRQPDWIGAWNKAVSVGALVRLDGVETQTESKAWAGRQGEALVLLKDRASGVRVDLLDVQGRKTIRELAYRLVGRVP